MGRHAVKGRNSIDPIIDAGPGSPDWLGAVWVGEIAESELTSEYVNLVGGDGFRRARLLVWSGDQPRGHVDVDVNDGAVSVRRIQSEAGRLSPVSAREHHWDMPPISVVVCTKDHPDDLSTALEYLSDLDYPKYEVVVVDNNPTSGLTGPAVKRFADRNVRVVEAEGQGLSIARNVGMRSAAYDIVAFTDDDVIVDRRWLMNLAYGFARDENVTCVCGLAASAELRTPAQVYFDRRVGWAAFESEIYSMAHPPENEPLFPLRVAQFGTGANFAVRKDNVDNLGGFDEGLGIGSPTGGGEDIDIFVRVLLGGHTLVREPSAVVWHRHRRTAEELGVQMFNYGLGLGAWITKLLCRPRTLGMVIRRVGPGVRHLRRVTVVDHASDDGVRALDSAADRDPELNGIRNRELVGVANGPLALARARLAGRAARPLKSPRTAIGRMFDYRRGQMWGEPGNSITAGMLALVAAVFGILGCLGAISVLPKFLLVILVGVVMLAGPGCLILSWYAHLPPITILALIPVLSISVSILVVSGGLMLNFYDPTVELLGMAAATGIGGLVRCGYLARRKTAPPT